MTENIKPCGGVNKTIWDWKKGDEFIDNTTGVNITKNIFDCGSYFFDGTFNVVKFEKGISIYHGSGIIADNLAGFPIGIPYYNPDSPNVNLTKSDQIAITTSDESIEEVISKYFEITAGWYGDSKTAELYSSSGSLKNICKDKCVLAYKLKKDIVMFLLDDDYNIQKLLATHNSIVSDDIKYKLRYMFDLEKHNELPVPVRFNKIEFSNKFRKSNRDVDLPFAKWICKNLIHKHNYSGYCANKQVTPYHGGTFHQEFIFCNAFKYLERDIENKKDWQYNDIQNNTRLPIIIKTYYDQLELYETTNVNFHSGNLLEHSIWTLLWSEYIMNENLISFSSDLIPENFKRIIAFTSFIHDIGKIYPSTFPGLREKHVAYNNVRDKYIYYEIKDHPLFGYQYILNEKQFPLYKKNVLQGYLNIEEMFLVFEIELIYRDVVAIIILLHWEYGNILKDYNSNNKINPDLVNQYLEVIYNNIIKPYPTINKKEFTIIVYCLIVVSMADNYATQPYGINRISEKFPDTINKHSKYFPFISNMSKNYKGINLPKISNINTNGVTLSNYIIYSVNLFWNKKTSSEEMDIEMDL